MDLDLVPEPEGAKERRVGPDSPSALDHSRPTNDPAVGYTALDRDRPGHAHDRKFTVEGEGPRRPVDPPGPEGDGWMLGGVEDLLEGLADLCAVGVVSGLTPPVPCRTWKESTSTWMVTEEFAGTAVSTVA